MITWGIVATAMTFVSGPRSFYLLRFLLGLGEAGFFPGIILYLTFWFPSRERARAVAKFMTATSLAGVVGGPLSSFLLKFEGRGGLHGWQWLFLSEGLPTILMGISVLFILRDKPADAPWLTQYQKQWLDTELERDRNEGGANAHHNLFDAFKLPLVWMLAAIYIVSQIGVYTVNLWMPLVLNSFVRPALQGSAGAASDTTLIARYSTFPYLAAAICTVLVGWSSDRTGDRRWHIAGCLTLSAIGFGWAGIAHSLIAGLCAFTLGAIGCWSMMGAFWALLTPHAHRPCGRRRSRHHQHRGRNRRLPRPVHHRPSPRPDPQLFSRLVRNRRAGHRRRRAMPRHSRTARNDSEGPVRPSLRPPDKLRREPANPLTLVTGGSPCRYISNSPTSPSVSVGRLLSPTKTSSAPPWRASVSN